MATDEYVSRIVRLIRGLIDKTNSGEVQWKAVSDYLFELPTGRATVTVLSVDRDGRDPFKVEILNKSGDLVESIHSIDTPYETGELQFNSLLADLFEVARRSALQIDDVIEQIFDDLGLE